MSIVMETDIAVTELVFVQLIQNAYQDTFAVLDLVCLVAVLIPIAVPDKFVQAVNVLLDAELIPIAIPEKFAPATNVDLCQTVAPIQIAAETEFVPVELVFAIQDLLEPTVKLLITIGLQNVWLEIGTSGQSEHQVTETTLPTFLTINLNKMASALKDGEIGTVMDVVI